MTEWQEKKIRLINVLIWVISLLLLFAGISIPWWVST